MTERRRLRRRWLAAGIAAAVLLAGAVFGWWWRSDEPPAELPASACWWVLTRDDLKPLAEHVHGTFVESQPHDEHLQPNHGDIDCVLRRKSGEGLGESLLWVQVDAQPDFMWKDKYGPDASSSGPGINRLDFGPDVQGWVGRQFVQMAFRCDNPENAARRFPYTTVGIRSGEATEATSEKVHRAVLDIALKYAKAVVASYPCSNPLHLPDSVPQSATNFPPPGP
ncbi:hypothetical protein [Kitasatospora cathayae]|uniref:DUF3558 domain-containing protein n=1 Tax=Kitasatospora cathayae TaxID=3004092 RepID=A0ABY7QA90_9ACTN|nr:hypothetical protein [Kitasatospora sp. HUAS 3-15]WBP89573.1 hypothetical protein O1G21_29515 [Kitasatospora sp. HUAS 3-15]